MPTFVLRRSEEAWSSWEKPTESWELLLILLRMRNQWSIWTPCSTCKSNDREKKKMKRNWKTFRKYIWANWILQSYYSETDCVFRGQRKDWLLKSSFFTIADEVKRKEIIDNTTAFYNWIRKNSTSVVLSWYWWYCSCFGPTLFRGVWFQDCKWSYWFRLWCQNCCLLLILL
jgi:hypothetical protein